MGNTRFYEDAARGGVWLGIAESAFTALGMWRPSALVSLAGVAVTVTLMLLFTKRRAAVYGGDEGYSYGQCLKFILCMSLFAGVLRGAYSIGAAHFICPGKYHEIVDRVVVTLSQTGLYDKPMLERIRELYEKMFFSPLWVVLTNVLSMVMEGLFFGLIVAAFARREPQLSGERKQDDDDII